MPLAARPVVKRKESAIQAAVLGVFRAYQIACWPLQRERARGRQTHVAFRGCPDIFGTLPGGRSFYCEVKRPGNKPSSYQVAAMRKLAGEPYNAYVTLVHSVEEAEQAAKEATRQ